MEPAVAVLLFGVVAVVPSMLVAVFAALFFNLGIETWFSDRVRGTLEALRAQGRTAVSRCSFVTAYAERHPEYRDLVR